MLPNEKKTQPQHPTFLFLFLLQVDLTFDLYEDDTTVTSVLTMRPSYESSAVVDGEGPPELLLDGRADVELVSVSVDGVEVPAADYEVTPKAKLLLSKGLPADPAAPPFRLQIVTRVKPSANTSLEGLYVSGGNFCTQCEAEGFRGITFFPDRPDVMARYTTRVVADRDRFPVLLSNGNKVAEGSCEGKGDRGRHFALWEDPFPKPCYLFALVAGDLALTEGTFRTASGRDVALRFYCEARDASKVGFAIESLKKAMKWDEEVFGLEYDLGAFFPFFLLLRVFLFPHSFVYFDLDPDLWPVTKKQKQKNNEQKQTSLTSSLSPTSSWAPWRTSPSTSSIRAWCSRARRRRPTSTTAASKGVSEEFSLFLSFFLLPRRPTKKDSFYLLSSFSLFRYPTHTLRSSATSTSTTGRATASPAATGSS